MRNGFSKLGECRGVVALTTQRHAEDGMRAGEFWIQSDRLAKLRGSKIEFAELAFDEAEFEVEFGGRFGGKGFL